MPHRRMDRLLKVPDWVETIEDPCLCQIVLEALVARRAALRYGAEQIPSCAAALRAGDATLDAVALGRYRGEDACRKATAALRKYDSAAEGACPTAGH